MPKWLRGNLGATLALWLYAIGWGVLSAAIPDDLSKRAELASGVALSLIVASWMIADAHKRGRKLPYDFDSFVYFAWPVILPIYLFQTRKWRAFLTLLCVGGVWLLCYAAAFVVTLLQKSES
jgi:hypothetical protein